MQYTKPMIELVFEIRRRVNANTKPGIKLANPDLLRELAGLYHASQDTIIKALIEKLLALAGDNWSSMLTHPETNVGSYLVKVYRGQSSLQAKPEKNEPKPTAPQVRYYRGARVA